MALGYIVNRGQDPKALRYLQESARPEVWRQRKVAWTSPHGPTEDARSRQLTEVAILGLALSGHPRAAETLREVQARGAAAGASDVQRRLGTLAGDALREHAAIAARGLAEYYR
jgi:hypothetical protein